MKRMTFDFVSDVSCPWCVIGLRGLEIALERVGELVQPEIRFHPFELNPDMPPDGENVLEHVGRKYGSSPEQLRENRASMKERAAALGFVMNSSDDSRIWNTFDAHRLLHWAGLEGRQLALKHALFDAYFTAQQRLADRDVLVGAAIVAGLNSTIAREVLSSGQYAEEVRLEERRWLTEGVPGVPHIVINDAFVISGGQPPEKFERALRHIASEASTALSAGGS
jgi:predicted DsbA family dithiol-disulfide isomerase